MAHYHNLTYLYCLFMFFRNHWRLMIVCFPGNEEVEHIKRGRKLVQSRRQICMLHWGNYIRYYCPYGIMLLLLIIYLTFIIFNFSVFNQLCCTFRPCILMLDSQSGQVSDSMDVFQNIRRLVLFYFYVNTAQNPKI